MATYEIIEDDLGMPPLFTGCRTIDQIEKRFGQLANLYSPAAFVAGKSFIMGVDFSDVADAEALDIYREIFAGIISEYETAKTIAWEKGTAMSLADRQMAQRFYSVLGPVGGGQRETYIPYGPRATFNIGRMSQDDYQRFYAASLKKRQAIGQLSSVDVAALMAVDFVQSEAA